MCNIAFQTTVEIYLGGQGLFYCNHETNNVAEKILTYWKHLYSVHQKTDALTRQWKHFLPEINSDRLKLPCHKVPGFLVILPDYITLVDFLGRLLH